MTSEEFIELSCYLTKQRHILLEEGNVEEHSKVVEERELREERIKSDNPFPIQPSREDTRANGWRRGERRN